jgi:hypothetical protein
MTEAASDQITTAAMITHLNEVAGSRGSSGSVMRVL